MKELFLEIINMFMFLFYMLFCAFIGYYFYQNNIFDLGICVYISFCFYIFASAFFPFNYFKINRGEII